MLNKIKVEIYSVYFKLLFKVLSFRSKNKRVVIFDLDNTISNTWPMLKNSSKNYLYTFKNASAFPSMVHLVNEYCSKNYQVIYLTARNYKYYLTTLNWIKMNDLPKKKNVLMVDDPHDKLWFLEKIVKSCSEVIFYDDLSFNHENGEIKYYEELIDRVRKLNLRYYGYSEILKLQQ